MAERSGSSGKCITNIMLPVSSRKHVADVSERIPTAKPTLDHVEHIHTNERVPGHSNYYEKNGVRTYGDGEDHEHEPPMTFKRIMSLVAMAFCKHLPNLNVAMT